MPLTLKKDVVETDDFPVVTSAGDEFVLVLRRPTAREMLTDEGFMLSAMSWEDKTHDIIANQRIHRVASCVSDWKGVVEEDGQVVPFTQDNLLLLLSQYPNIIETISDEARRRFDRRPDPKKSGKPSGISLSDGEANSTLPNSESTSEEEPTEASPTNSE